MQDDVQGHQYAPAEPGLDRPALSDTDVLAIATHELKGRITALRLHLDSLQRKVAISDGPVPRETLTPALSGMSRQVDRFSRLVGDLLEMNRAEGGRLRLIPETVDLTLLVGEIVERLAPEAAAGGCVIAMLAHEPIVGHWDGLRLDQAITNLVLNGIKYGAGGPVEVAVDSGSGTARIRVRDHGPGIPRHDLARIFEPFERLADDEPSGLGLGLYITARIVEQHGGTLTVHSAPGRGATFTVELPL